MMPLEKLGGSNRDILNLVVFPLECKYILFRCNYIMAQGITFLLTK